LTIFIDNSFDIVVSNNVLYNIPRSKRQDVITELYRIIKPGGRIVLANVHQKFAPRIIYLETVKENLKRHGLLSTVKLVVRMAWPTIKIFYYNILIQKAYKSDKNNLFEFEEQVELLRTAGFNQISPTKLVYANQAILNSAQK
ncbi:MAG TPA: methyltransferase domain-containing protein, partial [Flavobacterium sp.]|nr:methyltransferase domain-containing protein [Flavobacterium sp.]